MFAIFFILSSDSLYHKLRYSKTIKGDPAGALLGLIVGLFVGYLTLASVGSVSVDLSDLSNLLMALILFVFTCSSAWSLSILGIYSGLCVLFFFLYS